MNRQIRTVITLLLCVLTLASGCKPIQPYFFAEDGKLLGSGDLSHYMDVATDIDYPDINEPTLDEVNAAQSPLTLANAEDFDIWDLSLEEVTRIALSNSQVIRQLGGRIAEAGSNIALTTPELLQQNAANVVTTYDPAIVESGNGVGTGSPLSGTGVEAALSEFDAQLDSSIIWQKNNRPQNAQFAIDIDGDGIPEDVFARDFVQDLATGTIGITKTTADGTTFEVRNNYNYDQNNNGTRAAPSDWFVNFEAAFTRPLLQGAGTQLNRIAGPQAFQQAAAGVPNQIDGVIISRIRHDVTLTDFEAGVRNLMRDIEDTYWELYFAYRDLEARKLGRDSAAETWRKVKALQRVGAQQGEADREAQARSQFFLFRAQVESAQTNLFRLENRLRYMMGLTHSDGRLIRPSDEPTTAQVRFDWTNIHSEALVRRAELRRQKWQVKRREMELIAAKNNLLPRFDAGGRYRWLGGGDELFDEPLGIPPFDEGSNAFETLTTGRYQEWELSLQLSMPIGFRQELAGIRHIQLLLARERAVLQDLELEVSHQLGDAIRDIDLNYGLTQTNFNQRVARQDEVDAVTAVYDSGRVTLDRLLEAQRFRAEAESAYYRSLVDYNRAIMRLHYRKGSLLEYNGVYLAEGPWPGKAYFDALRRARHRDASTMIDYGFTRPAVISRGPQPQQFAEPLPAPQEPTPIDQAPVDQHPENQEESLPTEEIPIPEIINPANRFQQDSATTIELMGYTEELPTAVDQITPPGAQHYPETELVEESLESKPITAILPVTMSTVDRPTPPEEAGGDPWFNSTSPSLPAEQTPTPPEPLPPNPFSPDSKIEQLPKPSITNESQANHSPAEASPAPSSWPGEQR